VVFWVGLLRVGCTATASQMAAALGDELAISAEFAVTDARTCATCCAARWRCSVPGL
jgi:hypothetical protein